MPGAAFLDIAGAAKANVPDASTLPAGGIMCRYNSLNKRARPLDLKSIKIVDLFKDALGIPLTRGFKKEPNCRFCQVSPCDDRVIFTMTIQGPSLR
jgi:hypothetical protein